MITKHEAMTATEFHETTRCQRLVGPRGGVTAKPMVWRRNGRTQTWKRDGARFQLPVKRGLYEYAHLTESNAADFVVAGKCPVCHPGEEE